MKLIKSSSRRIYVSLIALLWCGCGGEDDINGSNCEALQKAYSDCYGEESLRVQGAVSSTQQIETEKDFAADTACSEALNQFFCEKSELVISPECTEVKQKVCDCHGNTSPYCYNMDTVITHLSRYLSGERAKEACQRGSTFYSCPSQIGCSDYLKAVCFEETVSDLECKTVIENVIEQYYSDGSEKALDYCKAKNQP